MLRRPLTSHVTEEADDPQKDYEQDGTLPRKVPYGASDVAAIASLWVMAWNFLPCEIGIRPDAGITVTRGSFSTSKTRLTVYYL